MAAHTTEDADWPALQRARRSIVVVDVVESVRLMQQHEDDVIGRWRRFVNEAVTQVLPPHAGRLVKSLGDGMLLTFDQAPHAVAAALEMQRRAALANTDRAPDERILLRCGVHAAEVLVDELDVYGSGVNLAARLAALAGPGETVVSAEARDALVDGLDAELADMGDCYVKHLARPVRAYRVRPPGAMSPVHAAAAAPVAAPAGLPRPDTLGALVAVIPFEPKGAAQDGDVRAVADLVADGVIALLSRVPQLRLVSRMSTGALKDRALALPELATLLGADYVLSGAYTLAGGRLVLAAELAEVQRGEVLWAERIVGSIDDLLVEDSQTLQRLAEAVQRGIADAQIRQARLQPPPNLRSYALQTGGIALMHRASGEDFHHAAELLTHLVERHPRLAAPRAWLAKWHVLRVTRGLVQDSTAEAAQALEHTRRAMDADPDCSLALAMQGFVRCHMLHDLDGALQTLDDATTMNPSESLAWLFKGVVHSLWGEGEQALAMVMRARALSPLDPLRYYYDALSAPAALAAGRYALAAELAESSLRQNSLHSPTLRALAIAQAELGELDAAQATMARLRRLEPGLTVASYLERSPAGPNETRRRYADALQRAGLPLR